MNCCPHTSADKMYFDLWATNMGDSNCVIAGGGGGGG